MGARMRALDWTQTPLGAPDTWPRSLKTVVRILLTSRYAMWMAWGADLTFFCNDAYRPTLGVKDPWALGKPARIVWSEVFDEVIVPRLKTVMEAGEATWDEALLLFLERSGYPEETYHTFSYSPLPDDDGRTAGMLCVVMEETSRIIDERRLAMLRDLAAELAGTKTQDDVLQASARVMAANAADLPFTLTYLFDAGGQVARRGSVTGIAGDHDAAPAEIDGADPTARWPLAELLEGRESVSVRELSARFSNLPRGAWDTPPHEAVVVPIAQQGQDAPAGALVIGLNPYRPFDPAYAGFVNLVAGQIASALANARAYEDERRRAEALAEIDRAKTVFFSNISHEFRTPLTLMLAPLEDALNSDAALAPANAELLRLAQRNAQRLLKLVNALLDFSRIEAGRVQARYQEVALDSFTAELASTFRSAIERAGLRLVVDCPALPEPAYIDPDMWEKVVLNLLSNAFKFTLAGEIRVQLRAENGQFVLRVADTGTGVPAHELSRLFERFHRVEGARGRSMEGSGIGLALVQELVKLHGGTIDVDSTLDQGSVFTVTIPAGHGHLPADQIEAASDTAPQPGRAQSFIEEAMRWLPDAPAPELPAASDVTAARRDRVLVVDDNADMRDYVVRLLRQAGYAVEAAADGRSALGLAAAGAPDLVISDVMMPGLDGFGLLRALREDAKTRGCPIILLSARAGEEAKVDGLGAGADDYLTKPFTARELLARVSATLHTARMRREIERQLESVVATRTADLQIANQRLLAEAAERERVEQALRQAQKMEAIGQLTGGVAHDFNNLLTIIIGNLETMQRRLGEESIDLARLRRSAENARRGAQRAAALTKSLLAFSRRQPLEPRPIDANKMVATMSDLLRRTLGERIVVETVLSGGLWRTHADPNQLESAILNLAVNARDAMPDGGKLTIETANAHLDESYTFRHAEVPVGQYVVICLTDTGIGMDADVLAHAFEPFFTTKDIGHGTGLGLSQVYGFVKQSGGHVKIYSEPGQGTTVKLYLPRLIGEGDMADPSTSAQPVAAGAHAETILVVEDDPDVRAHSSEILHDLGYRVIEAANGAAALEILEREPDIKLLFTDVGLPGGMNGKQLADAARARQRRLKVLFTTGYARNAIVHDGRLDPGVQLVTKPFTYEQLASKLRDMFDAHEGPPCVLVVEDETLVRMLAVDYLQSQGLRAEEAGSATEALNKMKVADGRIHAAILDVGLPDRTGDALVPELRAIDARLPIVLATGYSGTALRKQFAGDSRIRFVEKPYAEAQLIAALTELGIDMPGPAATAN